jgi:hypothetical protein
MLNVLIYDWKENVDSLIAYLIDKRQGKVSYFYTYDTQGDDFCVVVSDKELSGDEIKKAYDEYINSL